MFIFLRVWAPWILNSLDGLNNVGCLSEGFKESGLVQYLFDDIQAANGGDVVMRETLVFCSIAETFRELVACWDLG